MKTTALVALCILVQTLAPIFPVNAQGAEPRKVLINNANIFDGRDASLAERMSVLIIGDKIARIAGSIEKPEGATEIDAGGRTLIPGLIDAHVHLMWNQSVPALVDSHPTYVAALGMAEAESTLMRGFTTVRDITGPAMGLRRAIDEGLYPGPRIYCSGAGIGMTSGHGDFRSRNSLPRQIGGPRESELERLGFTVFADGVSEMLTASREQFRQGANFLKVLAGGAVTGLRDPIDISEYSFDELKAAADEAKRWNTYLAVHAYTDMGVRTALEAGAISIEHATLISEPTMKLLAEKGAWLSTQTGIYLEPLPDGFSDDQKAKQKQAADGLDLLMRLARLYKVKIALGSDLAGSRVTKRTQVNEFTNRLKWFTPVEILRQATSNNGELMALCGPRNPYPGKLGVVEEGAYADLLLVNGNPLQDISLLTNPNENLLVIMKGGTIYKNLLR